MRLLTQGRDDAEILTQLAAVSHALERAGLRLIADSLRRRLASREEGLDPRAETERLERLLHALR
jgi:DNA-binding FrmR family transcriptional regulator